MSTFDFNGLFDKLEYPIVLNTNARELTDIARQSLKDSIDALSRLKDMRRNVQDRLDFYTSLAATPDSGVYEPAGSLATYNTNQVIELWRGRIELIDAQIDWQQGMIDRHKDNLSQVFKQQEETRRVVVEILRESITDYRNSEDTS